MSENKQSKEITNEELARMIAKGFADTASKKDIDSTKKELKEGMADIRLELKEHDQRLSRYENKVDKALYSEFERIDDVEKQLKVVRKKLSMFNTV